MCAILGCTGIVILRPKGSTGYEVIGECYLHGRMDTETFLGPLEAPWKVKCKLDSSGYWYPYFVNVDSSYETADDPRLGPMPSEWETVETQRTSDDPPVFVRFRNKVTGEIMNSNPQMLPEALRQRGSTLR